MPRGKSGAIVVNVGVSASPRQAALRRGISQILEASILPEVERNE